LVPAAIVLTGHQERRPPAVIRRRLLAVRDAARVPSCYNVGMTQAGVVTPGRPHRIRYSIQSLGWRRALHEIATGRKPYVPAEDLTFDARHGTDTAGSVETDELGIADDAAREQAILYLPSPLRVTRWMLDHVGVDPTERTFVDLGCGKGRVLLVAAQRPFRRVVGVEISERLATIAADNAGRYVPPPPPRSGIEVITADVTTVDLPSTDLLIHAYHPFGTDILARVLERLELSLAAQPRRVTIAYLAYTHAVAEVAATFGRFDWLHITRYEQSVRGHYNWMFVEN
jgi:predicted RNA methylase